MDTILCPTCPLCSQPPLMAFSLQQVICTNKKCNAICWDATKDLDWNLTNATAHEFNIQEGK